MVIFADIKEAPVVDKEEEAPIVQSFSEEVHALLASVPANDLPARCEDAVTVSAGKKMSAEK